MTPMLLAAFVAASATVGAAVSGSGTAAASGASATTIQAPQAYSRDWKRIRSENFVAAGNADYVAMRSVLMELEGFRRALLRSLPSLRVASAVPTTVVVFKDEGSFARFKPRDEEGRRRERVAGYFVRSAEANYLVVPMHRNAARTFHYLFHEYTHFIVRQNMGDVPEWLNEGMAEFYSTFRAMPRERRAVVGEPPQNRLPRLSKGWHLPLRDLLTMGPAERAQAGNERQQQFYAQSWAFVHFLTLGDSGRHRRGVVTYLEAVEKGASVDAAVESAFGMSIQELEAAVASYARRMTFPQVTIDDPDGAVQMRTTLEAMLKRDVAALQRDLLDALTSSTAPHR